jgi:hypothetical protein
VLGERAPFNHRRSEVDGHGSGGRFGHWQASGVTGTSPEYSPSASTTDRAIPRFDTTPS